jgi:hypothetical protein
MTKTSTPSQIVNFPKPEATVAVADEGEQQDLLFYNSIKPQLDELVKNPSDETMQKILAYSKKK